MPGDDPSRTTRTPAAPPGAGGPRPAAAPTAAASEAAGSGRTSPSRTLFALATLAAGVCAAVVAQVFLAGLGLLVDPRYLAWHSSFVHVIEVAALALLALGIASRVGGLAALSVAPFVLTGAQYALIHGFDGPVRALHAVNAFAVFGASWALARRAAAASEPRVAGARHRPPQRPDARLGPTVAALSLVLVGAAGLLADAEGTGAGGAPATVSGAPDAGPADEALGARVYAARCSGCHGGQGEGRVGPRLSGNRALADRDFVLQRVTNGGGIMPAFGRSLSAQEVAAVVDHVRSSWGNAY